MDQPVGARRRADRERALDAPPTDELTAVSQGVSANERSIAPSQPNAYLHLFQLVPYCVNTLRRRCTSGIPVRVA